MKRWEFKMKINIQNDNNLCPGGRKSWEEESVADKNAILPWNNSVLLSAHYACSNICPDWHLFLLSRISNCIPSPFTKVSLCLEIMPFQLLGIIVETSAWKWPERYLFKHNTLDQKCLHQHVCITGTIYLEFWFGNLAAERRDIYHQYIYQLHIMSYAINILFPCTYESWSWG